MCKGLGLSGLAHGEVLEDCAAEKDILSVGGRGDKGTFQRLASSGRSSSASLYSASSSLTDFLLGCHEPLLTAGLLICTLIGAKPGLLGDFGLGIGLGAGDEVDNAGAGDGDLDLLRLLIAVIAREGVDEFLRLRPILAPYGRLREWAAP